MGITSTHFNYYLSKQPIKWIYLVVKLGGINITAYYEINKPSLNSKSLAVCATKKDTSVYYEFASITKAAEFLEVTFSFLSRCVREGNPLGGIKWCGKNMNKLQLFIYKYALKGIIQ